MAAHVGFEDCQTLRTSRLWNLGGESQSFASRAANSPFSGRLEFSMAASYDANSTMFR